jgi:hypothetical protein
MLTNYQCIVAFTCNKVAVELSRELAPVLRNKMHTLLDEFNTMMHQQGVWPTARYMQKRGFPLEFALAAYYWG